MNTKKLAQLIVIIIILASISLPSWAQEQKNESKLSLTRFTVSTDQKRVSIDWSVENGVPANYFEIQKSKDGVNFKTIALVLGPDPKEPAGNCYGYFDKYARKSAKHCYYRLKHIDTGGTEQVSETKLIAKL